ncbi:hypothetical protein ACEUC8_18565 [Aeromonas veronii]
MTMDIFAFRKQWRMMKARIQATWFWRVFGVRAMALFPKSASKS